MRIAWLPLGMALLAVRANAQTCNHKCPVEQRDESGCCPAAPAPKPKPPVRPKPKLAAAPAASAPVAAPPRATLLLLPDADCEIFVDGESAGRAVRNELKRVTVETGGHTVVASADDGRTFRAAVNADGAGQFAVNVEFPPAASAAAAPAPTAAPAPVAEENLEGYVLSPEELRRIPIQLDDATPVQGVSAMRAADKHGRLPAEIRRTLGEALRRTGFEVTAVPARTPLKLRILAVPGLEGLHWTMSRIEVAVEYGGRLVDRFASVTPMQGTFGMFTTFFNDDAQRFCDTAAGEVAAQLPRSVKLKKLLKHAAP